MFHIKWKLKTAALQNKLASLRSNDLDWPLITWKFSHLEYMHDVYQKKAEHPGISYVITFFDLSTKRIVSIMIAYIRVSYCILNESWRQQHYKDIRYLLVYSFLLICIHHAYVAKVSRSSEVNEGQSFDLDLQIHIFCNAAVFSFHLICNIPIFLAVNTNYSWGRKVIRGQIMVMRGHMVQNRNSLWYTSYICSKILCFEVIRGQWRSAWGQSFDLKLAKTYFLYSADVFSFHLIPCNIPLF